MVLAMASALESVLPLQLLRQSEANLGKGKTPAFISWPRGEQGHRVLDAVLDMPPDKFFSALWGAKAPAAALCRKKNGVQCYTETPWQASEVSAENALVEAVKRAGELDKTTKAWELPFFGGRAGRAYKGLCRMSCSEGHRMGASMHSFERERCLEAADGGPYRLEVCVHSTAKLSNRFRCVFNHRIVPVDEHSSRWTVDFALVFVEKTNFILRKPIEAGALGEIKRNFKAMSEILQDYAAQPARAA